MITGVKRYRFLDRVSSLGTNCNRTVTIIIPGSSACLVLCSINRFVLDSATVVDVLFPHAKNSFASYGFYIRFFFLLIANRHRKVFM